MIEKHLKIILALLGCMLVLAFEANAKSDLEESQIKVAMRTIGHQFLLQAGDSVSRILAIEKEEGRYKIEFSDKFRFDPKHLVSSVSKVMLSSKIAVNYLVELESCGAKQVVYSYEVGLLQDPSLIPCGGRALPENCYIIYFSILDVDTPEPISSNSIVSTGSISLMAGALVLLGLVFYSRRKRPSLNPDPNTIWIGDYSYDKKTMILSHKGSETELSSKEADLLLLLYSEENKVLERENILKVVWGDKGDYVGRTLDVFISKLRKKLAADPNLKIVNIRGIGYKFILADKK